MSASFSPSSLASRACGAIGRRVRWVRDVIEWRASHALRGEPPWCRNRWGHRYQALSLSEYHYLRDGNPETHEAALLERLLKPGMTVVDVGANHGLFTLEAAHFVGPTGRLHAFEPTPSTFERLTRNLSANGLGTVATFNTAVGAAPGVARLRVHREETGLNSLAADELTWNHRPLHADELVEVPVVTLDDHVRDQCLSFIDFLKVDVEGFELSVVRGARRTLAERRIRWMLLEVGDLTCAAARVDPADILAEVTALGYRLHWITPEGRLGRRVEAFPQGSFMANFLAEAADEPSAEVLATPERAFGAAGVGRG